MTSESIQELLDLEARLSNECLELRRSVDSKYAEIRSVKQKIRDLREQLEEPVCFGTDDCSTQALSVCPWRFDCGP